MAFKAGKDSFFNLDNVAGSPTVLSPYVDTFDWPQSVDTLDVSAFGTSSKAFIPGLIDGDTVAVSGPYDVTMFTHLTAVKAAQAAGSSTASLLWGPGGSVSGQAKVSAEVYVKSLSFKAGVGGRAEYSATMQVTGAVTNSTF